MYGYILSNTQYKWYRLLSNSKPLMLSKLVVVHFDVLKCRTTTFMGSLCVYDTTTHTHMHLIYKSVWEINMSERHHKYGREMKKKSKSDIEFV